VLSSYANMLPARVRFATTRALFETFPDLRKKIGAEPTDQCPIGFLGTAVLPAGDVEAV
jgi:hypothetical protein